MIETSRYFNVSEATIVKKTKLKLLEINFWWQKPDNFKQSIELPNKIGTIYV